MYIGLEFKLIKKQLKNHNCLNVYLEIRLVGL